LFNRRFTQTYADHIIALADLAKAKLHALRANSLKTNRAFKSITATLSIFRKYFPRSGMTFFCRAGLLRHSFSDGWSLGKIVCVILRVSAVNLVKRIK
jgi:hypothetical protein